MRKLFLVAILLLVFAGFAFAQHGMGKGMMHSMGMESKMGLVHQVLIMADYLGLSNEQLEKFCRQNRIHLVHISTSDNALEKLCGSLGMNNNKRHKVRSATSL